MLLGGRELLLPDYLDAEHAADHVEAVLGFVIDESDTTWDPQDLRTQWKLGTMKEENTRVAVGLMLLIRAVVDVDTVAGYEARR